MANMLQSAQTQATQAPSFYTDYLSNIASKAQGFLPGGPNAPQYVGAQPLQEKAFQAACSTAGTYQPFVQTGQQYLGQAAGTDITGAAQPFLAAGTSASPLCAARPLINTATCLNLGCLAGQYMNPFVRNAVSCLADIGMRNIRTNLSPLATAAAVGSGQFGSQRGAQVLGQVQSNAMRDLNSQIANMLTTGYGQALTAAGQKQSALGQLANTTASAQQAQNQAQLQAGQTAANAAAQEAQALQQAGLGMGTLGQAGQGISLADINALSTLGGQQQTIEQNRQMFPLTNLSNLASILQGYSIPTETRTTLCMSPLSGLGTIASGALGMMTPRYDAQGRPIAGSSPFEIAKASFGKLFGSDAAPSGGALTPGPTYENQTGTADSLTNFEAAQNDIYGRDDIPSSYYDYYANGGVVKAKSGGAIGCASTRKRGGLPS
jgi:hypothetical protein